MPIFYVNSDIKEYAQSSQIRKGIIYGRKLSCSGQ